MSESRIFTAYQHHSEDLEQSLAINADSLEQYARTLSEVFAGGQRLVIVASGPLAGVASTLVNAFLYHLGVERPALPVVALNHDTGLAATLCCDKVFDQYFSCQLQAQANPGDCVFFLDCSAGSPMLAALQTASEIGCATAVLTFGDENAWKKEDPDLVMPIVASSPARGVEAALFLGQILCELVEAELFGF
ncbi:MAG: SIS domain-containing protein [Thermodesulfobacteriota bacterium]|nr:SIS domain-containing protein [Thermodesulfobacteriota bacterium]